MTEFPQDRINKLLRTALSSSEPNEQVAAIRRIAHLLAKHETHICDVTLVANKAAPAISSMWGARRAPRTSDFQHDMSDIFNTVFGGSMFQDMMNRNMAAAVDARAKAASQRGKNEPE